MCRLLCYLGPSRSLAELILDPPRGLGEQAHAPRYQSHGTMNADGFGAGWYDHARSMQPAVYRRALPIWNDRTFADIARIIASDAVLAAVRSATSPSPVHESNTPPYRGDGWLFAHNGAVDGFSGPAGEELRRAVPAARAARIEGSTDSETLFALMLSAMDQGLSPAAAMIRSARSAHAITGGGRMTMLATDGARIVGMTWGDTLFVRDRPDAVTVASEPSDDDEQWQRVPDRTLIQASTSSVSITAVDQIADKESA